MGQVQGPETGWDLHLVSLQVSFARSKLAISEVDSIREKEPDLQQELDLQQDCNETSIQ